MKYTSFSRANNVKQIGPVDRIDTMYFVTYATYVTCVTFSSETIQVKDCLALTDPMTRHQEEALLHV